MAPLENYRHEKFVRCYVKRLIVGSKGKPEGWHGRGYGLIWRAYQDAYPHVTKHTVLLAASARLHRKPHIQQRIREVTKSMLTRMDITEERILGQYQDAYDLAAQQGKTADMISASTAQAKLVGLLRDRIEAGAPGDFDKLENVSDVLAALEKQAGPEAALGLAKVLGLAPKDETNQEAPEGHPEASEQDTSGLEELEPPTGAVN
jgi:hypothetical protein